MMALIADKPAHLQVTLQRNVRSPLLGVPRGVEPRRRLVLQRTFAAVQEAGVGKGGTVKGGSGDTDKPEVYGRSDLYAELASKTGLAPKSAKEVADHVLKIIEHQVGEGKKVALMGKDMRIMFVYIIAYSRVASIYETQKHTGSASVCISCLVCPSLNLQSFDHNELLCLKLSYTLPHPCTIPGLCNITNEYITNGCGTWPSTFLGFLRMHSHNTLVVSATYSKAQMCL